ncbi:hypothetical protein ABNX05_11075 [Lysinibacillus sp. M3]|uniref:Uncharacterized protein n=1 Tax=Lysinibacillus zambalensis TaxID=3160866 RepID=A0ABV1MRM1_9BACI
MRKFIIRVYQNGGEYSGLCCIKCDSINLDHVDKNILICDDIEIQYDELIEEIHETDINDNLNVNDYAVIGMDEYKELYSIYN